MFKNLALTLALAVAVTVAAQAQDKKLTTADFAGTWNIEVMSHQIALVIEPTEGNHVTATMMMMGRDMPLKGELVGRTHFAHRRQGSAVSTAAPAAERRTRGWGRADGTRKADHRSRCSRTAR